MKNLLLGPKFFVRVRVEGQLLGVEVDGGLKNPLR
jgi:hypothetical protein